MAALILAGCGGSGKPNAQPQAVTGPGFRFQAPAGWKITHTPSATAASRDSELVQVARFKLVHPYTDKLFDRVAGELAARMKVIAAQTRGTIVGAKTVTAAGIRSHAYDVKVGDHLDQYTFVLRQRREFQLLCRRRSSSSDAFCAQLVKSFAPA